MTDLVVKGGAASAALTTASAALNEQLHVADTLPPSKVQNYLSELFRIALCRNDDYNLAGSSTIRATKQFASSKPGAGGNQCTAGVL